MVSEITKNIIIRALSVRAEQGEKPDETIENYQKLTEEEKQEILMRLKNKTV